MGNGHTSGPVDATEPAASRRGTAARIKSPHPGPVGLDARSAADARHGAMRVADASIRDQIVGFPRREHSHRVGHGECFAWTDRALRAADARSSADHERAMPDAGHVVGRLVVKSMGIGSNDTGGSRPWPIYRRKGHRRRSDSVKHSSAAIPRRSILVQRGHGA